VSGAAGCPPARVVVVVVGPAGPGRASSGRSREPVPVRRLFPPPCGPQPARGTDAAACEAAAEPPQPGRSRARTRAGASCSFWWAVLSPPKEAATAAAVPQRGHKGTSGLQPAPAVAAGFPAVVPFASVRQPLQSPQCAFDLSL